MGIRGLCKFLHEKKAVKYHESLNDFLDKYKKNYIDYCRLGIDSSVYMYRYKQVHGKYFLLALLKQSFKFLLSNVIPVYIFDGKPPDEKKEVLKHRHQRRLKNSEKLMKIQKIEQDICLDCKYIPPSEGFKPINYEKEVLRISKQLVRVQKEDVNNVINMLNICKIPFIHSQEEADTALGELYRQGYIDFALTYDMDLLLRGCKKIISFTPGGHIEEYDLDYILERLGLTYDQFVDMSILFGCDGVPQFIKNDNYKHYQLGIYNLIVEYGSIEKILNILYVNNNCILNTQIEEYLDKCINARLKYNERNANIINNKFSTDITERIDFDALLSHVDNIISTQKIMINGRSYSPISNVPFKIYHGYLDVTDIHNTICKLNTKIRGGKFKM